MRLLESIHACYPSLKIDIQSTGTNLSWARNQLAKRCKTPFYFMLEEDFVLDGRTNIAAMLEVMHAEPNCGGVSSLTDEPAEAGTVGRGKRIWWDRDFVRIGKSVFFEPGRQPFRRTASGVRYRNCDLILNFGIFRTDVLRTIPWDEKIPIGGEHADWYWRVYLDGRWHFAHLPQVMCVHLRDRPGEDYNQPRKRDFRRYATQKNGVYFVRRAMAPHERPLLPNVVYLTTGRANSTIFTKMIVELFGFETGEVRNFAEERRVREINDAMHKGGVFNELAAKRVLRSLPQPWIIKDPRFRRFLPKWVPLLEPYQPLLLLITKDAAVVKASFQKAGWMHNYDPADADRCEESYAAWPWRKLRFTAEHIAGVLKMFDHSRTKGSSDGALSREPHSAGTA